MAERQKSVRLKRVELRNSLKSYRLTKSRPRLGNVTIVAADILTMIDLVQPKVLPVPHVQLRGISQKFVDLHKNRTSRDSRKRAFEQMKKKLTQTPVMAYFDISKRTMVIVDGSPYLE